MKNISLQILLVLLLASGVWYRFFREKPLPVTQAPTSEKKAPLRLYYNPVVLNKDHFLEPKELINIKSLTQDLNNLQVSAYEVPESRRQYFYDYFLQSKRFDKFFVDIPTDFGIVLIHEYIQILKKHPNLIPLGSMSSRFDPKSSVCTMGVQVLVPANSTVKDLSEIKDLRVGSEDPQDSYNVGIIALLTDPALADLPVIKMKTNDDLKKELLRGKLDAILSQVIFNGLSTHGLHSFSKEVDPKSGTATMKRVYAEDFKIPCALVFAQSQTSGIDQKNFTDLLEKNYQEPKETDIIYKTLSSEESQTLQKKLIEVSQFKVNLVAVPGKE